MFQSLYMVDDWTKNGLLSDAALKIFWPRASESLNLAVPLWASTFEHQHRDSLQQVDYLITHYCRQPLVTTLVVAH